MPTFSDQETKQLLTKHSAQGTEIVLRIEPIAPNAAPAGVGISMSAVVTDYEWSSDDNGATWSAQYKGQGRIPIAPELLATVPPANRSAIQGMFENLIAAQLAANAAARVAAEREAAERAAESNTPAE